MDFDIISSFSVGCLLRFTPITPLDYSSAPKPPVSPKVKHWQGTLLEIKDGKLVVSFDGEDLWDIGFDDYR